MNFLVLVPFIAVKTHRAEILICCSLEHRFPTMYSMTSVYCGYPEMVEQRHICSFNCRGTTTTAVLWPFFRDHPGEPVPEVNSWTLWCKGRLMEADTPTIRLATTQSGLTSAHLHHPPIFFTGRMSRTATQPTVSKHLRQLAHSD